MSVGIVGGVPVLDLDYAEDSDAETDMNVVMNNGGGFIEVQGTAEGHAFRRHELDALLDLAAVACEQLFAAQLEALQAPRRRRVPGPRRVSRPVARRGWSSRPATPASSRTARDPRALARRGPAPVRLHRARAAEETGRTFVENALLKARFAAQAAGLPAIADDSGLEVDALGGAPGMHSARYAGEGAGDAANNAQAAARTGGRSRRRARRALSLRDGVRRGARTIRRRSCARRAGRGRIATAPRGDGGFGYDPLFVVAGTDRAPAPNSSPTAKNRASHRGQALRALVAALGGGEARP